MDSASTKGAIVASTRSRSQTLIKNGVRVNAGQPAEIAPCYVFLASRDSSYIAGQVLHPNGGEPVGS